MVERDNQAPQLNDFLVTYASAYPIADPLNVFSLEGTYRKHHGTIADDAVAGSLLKNNASIPPGK